MRLPELVTASPEAYEALAIELGLQPARLQEIKRRLASNRLTTPLFDTRRFTANIEAAYHAMYQRHLAGLPPDHIHISDAARAPVCSEGGSAQDVVTANAASNRIAELR
jgi:hypothetical protein